MRRGIALCCVSLLLLVLTVQGQGPPALTVLRAAPVGVIADLAQANEIRIVFSEPMVVLGKVPQPVAVPFVTIQPAIAGTFRWSGTTILIFTPAQPLPYATSVTVTVGAAARATSGRALAAPYTFRFTTPPVRLLALGSDRTADRFDQPARLYLRFNQPVAPAAVLPHIGVRYEAYPWTPPALTSAAEARLSATDPAGLKAFRAKVARVLEATRSNAPVPVRLATTWNTVRYPPSPDLVVLETTAVPPPQTRLRVTVAGTVPSPGGPVTPGQPQVQVAEMEPAFFVDGFECTTACEPSRWNPIELTRDADIEALTAAAAVFNLSAGAAAIPRAPAPPDVERYRSETRLITLEELRYPTQPPDSTFAVRLAPTLVAVDGQPLGYPWIGVVENWHERAFTSFGDGHGVWERDGGAQLPFFARNVQDIRQWVTRVTPDTLMSRLLALQKNYFRDVPAGEGQARRLAVTPDAIQSHGLNLAPALGGRGTGLVWAGIEAGATIARTHSAWETDPVRGRRSTIVQVTNLGITVKDSPQNTLILVTRLDTGEPVADARVSIVRRDERVFWRGTTNVDGIALAPDTPLRDPRRPWEFAFIVLAEKDDDVAYVGSDWLEGVEPWAFGLNGDLGEAEPLLRGSVFTDRGVYRPGEEIHFKAILRRDAGRGVNLLPAGTPVRVTITDARGRDVNTRTIRLGEWSSAEWTFTLPAGGTLGTYNIHASMDERQAANRPAGVEEMEEAPRGVHGSFLVAAYRRPDFRVDATLTGGAEAMAGDTLTGSVAARYLFGAAMTKRPVTWTTWREPVTSAPETVLDRYLPNQWTFVGYVHDVTPRLQREDLERNEGLLDARGEFPQAVASQRDAAWPYRYTFEGDVEDVSRQRIAGRASLLVHPAPWYIGLRNVPYFVTRTTGVQTAVIAVTPQAAVVPDVQVEVALQQVQWNSVRRAEGGGFYTWETERRVVDISRQTVTTGADPVPVSLPIPSGGAFILTATAKDGSGRTATTVTQFYALGEGYTAWSRYDHNRIDLVPERATYKPGDTARIMIQSPWERATALVTTEREGVRSSRRVALTSTQQTVTVPITADDIPNVYVSVLLIKGRTNADAPDDGSDPGKPSFRLGYVELQVEDASKRLAVEVRANREEYRPANRGRIDVVLRDAAGKPVSGEVTLWAVDYGVLSLTAFRTPDVLKSVYVPKALQVRTTDNRQRIVSRRAIVPKGGDEGGGGGDASGAGTLRRDFRVLAFWIGSTVADANGRATAQVRLPESLTTYRIMAVAADKASRFGWGQSEIRVNKPVTLQPAFPRFLAVGDRAFFGSVVTNQLSSGGSATVSIRSLDPAVLRIEGATTQRQAVEAGGAAEVRFAATARAIGAARVQMTVRLNGESDAYEEIVPVRILSSPETVAVHGQTQSSAVETLTMPGGAVPGLGGLTIDAASTALVGLGEGARYLVEYPYQCAEQRASRAMAMMLAADLGGAFTLPGIDAAALRPRAQQAIAELNAFSCPDGGFALWEGSCGSVSPYLTSYVLHVLHASRRLGYAVDAEVLRRAYDYLDRELTAANDPQDDGLWPAELAWRAFAAKVLVEGGRDQDTTINRLLPRVERMPVFALAYLVDALGTTPARAREREDLLRRIGNATMEASGTTHVEELTDPYLMWFWNSNVRTTAIVLNTLVQHGTPADLARIRPMVQWLLQAREDGRWRNTQENARVLEALVAYVRKYEAQPPAFTATVSLGGTTMLRGSFSGRSTTATSREVPLRDLAARLPADTSRPLTFEKRGDGTLFYTVRLRYAVNELFQTVLDNGIAITRSYAPFVDGAAGGETRTFKAGDLVLVRLRLSLTQERRFVAVTDPVPAGFELVESFFATTAAGLTRDQQRREDLAGGWWGSGGFEHVQRHDDRLQLFATRLSEGAHEFTYVVRATTAGTFRTAPAHAEQMYEPEVFGRTDTATVEVSR